MNMEKYLSFEIELGAYMSLCEQVVIGVEFSSRRPVHVCSYVLQLLLTTPSGEWKADPTFGRLAGIEPATMHRVIVSTLL